MKFYRSIRFILDKNGFMTILLLTVFPAMFYPLWKMMPKHNSGGLDFLILLMIVAFIGLGLYQSLYLFRNLINIRKVTLEIVDEGIFCPYLLKQSRLILWEEIQSIRLETIKSKNDSCDYIVIELNESVANIGDFKNNFGFDQSSYFRKKSSGQILSIPQDAINYCELADLEKLLLARWKKQVKPKELLGEGMAVRYVDITNFSSVLVVGAIIAILAFMAYSIGIRSISQLHDAVYRFIKQADITVLLTMGSIIFVGISMFGWIILKIVFDYLKSRLQAKIAINFDQYGISVLNDISFSPVLRWVGIRSIEVVQKQLRKTGYHQPFLEIEYIDSTGNLKKISIRNALKDTSVYELSEIMAAHRQFNGF